MLTGKTIITQILDENIIGAKESTHALLAQKAKVYLEDKRRCIASVTYGPCSEANGQGDCGCDEQVEEDCGCNDVEEGVEAYTLKKTKVEKNKIEPDSDEVQTIVYYDIMLSGKKVGEITWEDYFGYVEGTLHGKAIKRVHGKPVTSQKDVQPWLDNFLKSKEGAKFVMQSEEKLTDKQKKLDKNHNGVLDKQDFAIVRGKKKKEEE